MSSGPVRRSQLVAPFGVGALSVVPNGTSLIAAGLDHWYEREDQATDSQNLDTDEFHLEEWRLQAELRVSHFRLPPDWRTKAGSRSEPTPNLRLPVPHQRFPSWHFCPRCKRLGESPLSTKGPVTCGPCKAENKKPRVAQVPIVAICEYGHMQDFPWREWVHGESAPACRQHVTLKSTGGASLAAQTLECECGKKRTLSGVTESVGPASPRYPQTTLSEKLDATDEPFLCSGSMPWHGETGERVCMLPIQASLRAASNLYYAIVRSSIYLPRQTAAASEELIEALVTPPISDTISIFSDLGAAIVSKVLRGPHREILQPYTDAEIDAGILVVQTQETREAAATGETTGDETEFRRAEFRLLRTNLSSPHLEVRQADLARYSSKIVPFLGRLTLVDKLRETRALCGFNRLYPDQPYRLEDRKALLWKAQPDPRFSWLPAYVVHGEGIYFELDEDRLTSWEQRPDVQQRITRLVDNYGSAQAARQLRERTVTPRFVLLHTLAHILMNQLTFDCGYSSASLRERIYVSSGAEPMAALLIYTAAGDSEGTMGGVVRMGKPGYFEPAVVQALDSARWCSSDPVCMELGEAGQGPDSCNMAACHGCALVPETACEEFNRFLDRALLIGTHTNPSLGYFSSSDEEAKGLVLSE
jgi:hypothetical protein